MGDEVCLATLALVIVSDDFVSVAQRQVAVCTHQNVLAVLLLKKLDVGEAHGDLVIFIF